LKLSTLHKNRGDTTELVLGTNVPVSQEPDVIYITSLFTWAWEPVWKAIRFYSTNFPSSQIWLGGLYASLLPEHAALSGISPERIHTGLFTKAENLCPDYSLVPDWNQKSGASIIFSSRGCIRKCGFCAVSQLEGSIRSNVSSIKDFIWPGHKKVILFDNNFLASPTWRKVLDEIRELDLRVDFNQGLDARLISRTAAKMISQVKVDKVVRLSYDYRKMGTYVKRAIHFLNSVGIKGKSILVYTLYNFTDSPQDFFERMRDILQWGAVCYPMRYEPLTTLYKNRYVAPGWDEKKLDAIARARRVIGYGGAFAPHEGMLKVKAKENQTFEDSFGEFTEPLEAT
jgi:hypothetical protein